MVSIGLNLLRFHQKQYSTFCQILATLQFSGDRHLSTFSIPIVQLGSWEQLSPIWPIRLVYEQRSVTLWQSWWPSLKCWAFSDWWFQEAAGSLESRHPIGSTLLVNGLMIDPSRPVQFLATFAWCNDKIKLTKQVCALFLFLLSCH